MFCHRWPGGQTHCCYAVTVGTRGFKPGCRPVLALTDTAIGISKLKVVLLLFATLLTKDSLICTELRRELPAAL